MNHIVLPYELQGDEEDIVGPILDGPVLARVQRELTGTVETRRRDERDASEWEERVYRTALEHNQRKHESACFKATFMEPAEDYVEERESKQGVLKGEGLIHVPFSPPLWRLPVLYNAYGKEWDLWSSAVDRHMSNTREKKDISPFINETLGEVYDPEDSLVFKEIARQTQVPEKYLMGDVLRNNNEGNLEWTGEIAIVAPPVYETEFKWTLKF